MVISEEKTRYIGILYHTKRDQIRAGRRGHVSGAGAPATLLSFAHRHEHTNANILVLHLFFVANSSLLNI